MSTCPHEIWAVTNDANKRVYINEKNISKCTLDNACIDSCPTGSIEIIPTSF